MNTIQAKNGMANAANLLPKEVTALIHHIELNKDGWWDKAAQRLVLSAIWLAAQPPSIDQIAATMESEFRLKLSGAKLTSILSTLETQNSLVILPGDKYRIPDARRTEFEREIEASENAEILAHDFFIGLLKEQNLQLDTAVSWTTFTDKFLAPLIKEVGANAYRLVIGQDTLEGMGLIEDFLKHFPTDKHQKLRDVASQFLNPKAERARSYISRLLHARLCVEASGLPAEVISKIRDLSGKPIRFRVFVDTNFLFSLINLHDNPSNETARELQDLISNLKDNIKIDLYVTPQTIDEAKSAILNAKLQLHGMPMASNFTAVAMHAGISGMAQKYLMERARAGRFITAEDWFRPYLDNFVAIAKGKGVEIFNESQDSYSTRQDVIDDINDVLSYDEQNSNRRRKSYGSVKHDMVLWHFVQDKRPAYLESPIDARDWIITVDYRFIGFDRHKMPRLHSKVPLCLHPTSFIQLLQFWVPRTKEFEEAMLGSLRLPFLFQEFDAVAERTTLKILCGLGRFEGSSELPEATISNVVMNDGLRARLERKAPGDEEIILIRDALLEEKNKRLDAELQKTQQLEAALHDEKIKRIEAELLKSQQLEAAIQGKDAYLSELDREKKAQAVEIERLRSAVDDAGRQDKTQAALIADLKAKGDRRDATALVTPHSAAAIAFGSGGNSPVATYARNADSVAASTSTPRCFSVRYTLINTLRVREPRLVVLP